MFALTDTELAFVNKIQQRCQHFPPNLGALCALIQLYRGKFALYPLKKPPYTGVRERARHREFPHLNRLTSYVMGVEAA